MEAAAIACGHAGNVYGGIEVGEVSQGAGTKELRIIRVREQCQNASQHGHRVIDILLVFVGAVQLCWCRAAKQHQF